MSSSSLGCSAGYEFVRLTFYYGESVDACLTLLAKFKENTQCVLCKENLNASSMSENAAKMHIFNTHFSNAVHFM